MIKQEKPVGYREYYKRMKAEYSHKVEELTNKKLQLEEETHNLWTTVKHNVANLTESFNVELEKYTEFTNNEYVDGKFLNKAKSLYMNRKNNYTLVADFFDIYSLARKQKEIYDLGKQITLYDKVSKVSMNDYKNILKTFYETVHTRLITKGEGYRFEGQLGWTAIRRMKFKEPGSKVNYAATKKRKQELKAQGVKVFDKEEAEWCKQRGIEYNAVDPRVYLNDEYYYTIALYDCYIPNGSKYRLEIADYRGQAIRGKTNDELIKLCDNDIQKICKLPVDLKTKLTMCNIADKMLYVNFIRYEDK